MTDNKTKRDIKKIDSILISFLNNKEKEVLKNKSKESQSEIKYFFNAMRYSINSGGKRLRPLLLVNTLRLLGVDIFKEKEYLSLLVSIEYIHTFSLIHDDLPALDNDDLRRGKKTLHKKFREDIAILAGDAYLSFAKELLIKTSLFTINSIVKNNVKKNKNDNEVKLNNFLRASDLVCRATGIGGMIIGQVLDIGLNNKTKSSLYLSETKENKTSKMLRLPVDIALIISEKKKFTKNEQEKRREIKKYIEVISSVYQEIDDILDSVGSLKVLGKNTGSDKRNKKQTLKTNVDIKKKRIISKLNLLKAKLKIVKENSFYEYLVDFLISRLHALRKHI